MHAGVSGMRAYVLAVPPRSAPLDVPAHDALSGVLGQHPALVSSAVHGGFATACGASVGAVAGVLFWPAHVAALTFACAGILGTAGAVHGWQLGERVREQIGLPEEPSSRMQMVGATAHDVITTSTGSMMLDAAIGGVIGYALSPTVVWVVAGALLAGLGGLAGILLLAGAHIAREYA